MEILVIFFLVMVLLLIWIISTQRKLTIMDENVSNAMSQIGIQLSSRGDALTALLDLIRDYGDQEIQILYDRLRLSHFTFTAQSTPEEIRGQERMIAEVLELVSSVTENYPDLKEEESYRKRISALDSYEKMLRTSFLIYNDSVTKLNRAIRTFPTNLIAGMLGFRQREYMEAPGK